MATAPLHYVPADNLSRDQLLEHRAQITKANRFLAHRAGKAYKALVSGKDHGATVGKPVSAGKLEGHRIVTHAVVRPTPSVDLIASALVEVARERIEHEKEAA